MSVTLEAKEQRIGPVGSQLSENVLKTAPYAEWLPLGHQSKA
jgi:hypothetical protein